MTFESNVFLNCPFDDEYLPLRYAILFAIVDCGFIPRCALEIVDGSQLRMHSIKVMIKESRFGIHDISRTQLDPEHRLPRFNMPLEMGPVSVPSQELRWKKWSITSSIPCHLNAAWAKQDGAIGV